MDKKETIYIASYPKSGNTWIRFLIANLITNLKIDFNNLDKIIPDMYKKQNLTRYHKGFNLIKSHEPYNDSYKKAIYIVRNPFQVAVSYYHHLIKFNTIKETCSFKSFFEKFILGQFFPSTCNWNNHVLSWKHGKKEDNNILIIKYEDLKNDPKKIVLKMVSFMGLDSTENEIEKAIEKSSFKRLQKLESYQYNKGFLKDSLESKKFIRKSDLNEWKNYFTPKMVSGLKKEFKEGMKEFGYYDY